MRKITTSFLFLFIFFTLYAQNNCPLNIRVSTEEGTCYNNCMINISLVDGDNNPLDVSTTDLSDIKYFRIDMNTGDTAYSATNSFMVSVGTYKVGVEAVCYYSTSTDSMYVRMSKDTLVTTRTSYVTPVLSMINSVANSNTAHGTVHSLSCQNTGRIQLNITGGSFPYFVEIRDESGDPMDTVVFPERQYTGNVITQYDYKDYYSIDSLAPGKYDFYVWDGCGYHLPLVWQEIKTAELPHVTDVCFFNNSYAQSKDAVVHRMYVWVEGDRLYHGSFKEVAEYRFIYPEINGVRDTTPWKHFENGPTASTNQLTLHDTIYSANSFCDLYGKSITFQARNTLCEEFLYTRSYHFNKIREDMFLTGSSIAEDSSVTVPEQYDSCGYYTSRTTTYGSPIYSVASPYYYSTSCSYSHTYQYHYMPPVYWVYTDTNTLSIIKIDTLSGDGNIRGKYSYLFSDDIIPLYGSFEDSSITIPVRRTLYDMSGCELYTRFDDLTFNKRVTTTGGTYNTLNFSTGTFSNSDYCCSSRREIRLYSNYSPPMSFLGNVVVKLIVSPENNKYNFTATYNQDSQKWTIVRDSISNLANISTNGFNFYINDYCLPSGTYTYQINTSCSTYVVSQRVTFNSNYESLIEESAQYELIPNCTELNIKPVAGKYQRIIRNHDINGMPTINTYFIEPYFRIVNGPTGGYSTTSARKGENMRVTLPGMYVIEMSSSSARYCYDIYQYDTVYFSGGTVEFDYVTGYVCDSTATTGFVRAKGKNGTKPYLYSLYSAPDQAGTLLGENTTGRFDNIPLHAGQQVSVKITDSCLASFHINIIVLELEKTQKSWFADGLNVTAVCEGHHIQVYALGSEDYFSYVWTGPNGYHTDTRDATAFIPRDAEEGYYKVTLLNTGCANPLTDSVYVNVNRAPKVVIADDAIVCPGEEVQLSFTASGTGDVYYTIGHEENSVVSFQNYTNSDSYSYNPTSSGIFWVHEVSDNFCVYSIPEDTVHITLRDKIATSCDVLSLPDTVCPDGTALLSAYSILDAPYIIRWYEDFEQLHLLKADTIPHVAGQSQYVLTHLFQDSTLFVTVSNDTYCETQNGTIHRRMNMHAGNSSLKCGESMKLYDSGGLNSPYSKFENITHTFTSTNGSPLLLKFNSFITDTYSRLFVFTGSRANSDSIIATLSGNLNSNLPADIISNGASMTLQFVSTGATPNQGWDAVISNSPQPSTVTASVIDSVKLHLSSITATPIHYNGDITLQATTKGGKSPQFEYQWFSSEDGIVWNHEQTVVTNDTSYYNINNLIESLYVRVVVRDVSPTSCGITDTAVYYIPIAHIKLSLSLSVSTDDPCVSHNAVLRVRNDGQEAAEDIVCHVQAPEGLLELFGNDVINIAFLGPGESWTDTFRLSLINRPSVDTIVALKAQIWSCRQGDSVPEVIYGDWDWQGAPRYADEDSANIHLLPSFSASEYHITTINDEVCYGSDAQLAAFSDLAAPQYFNWYADAALSQLIQQDTIYHAGDHALHNISNLQTNTTLYVTLHTAEKCPPLSSGVMVYKFETPTTDTVIMNNGVTYVGAENHIKFYDSGGPEGNLGAEEFVHTFSTEEGVIGILFRKRSVNNLMIYDGNSVSGSLLLGTSGTSSSSYLVTSTTGSITVLSSGSTSSSYYGWEADVVNSQTFKSAEALATIKAPSTNIDISATHDTVCHGETAILTASSTIGFPQYFTWYNSDWTRVVLKDTLTSGISVLELPNLKTTEEFYVTVHNDSICPLFVAKDTLINKFIASSSQYNNQTVFIMRNESVTFTDEGGEHGSYRMMPVGRYITTFTALEGTVKAVFPSNTSQNRLSTTDTLYVYDGLEGDSLLFRGTGTTISNKTFMSSGNTLTFKFSKNSNGSYNYGWKATITNIPSVSYDTTQVWAYIREPVAGQYIITTSDTVCYNGTALLQASAPKVGYPQYYTWISQDLKNIVYQDTLDGIGKTKSTLLLENQRTDTLYYVTLKTDTVCPSMFYDDSIFIATPILKKTYDFLMTADKHNLTTEMQCTDSIRFLDDGGLSGNYASNMNVTHTFTSIDNEPVQLILSNFRTYNSGDYLILYNGTSTSAPQLVRLYGSYASTSMPQIYTANSGSLTVRWVTNNTYTQSGWEGYITTTNHCTDEVDTASVHVLPVIPAASIAYTTCQSTTLFSHMGFKDLDVSVPGNYTIDSVFTSSLGCDSAVTLNLTVAPSFFQEESAETCDNVPYVWTGHSVTIPTTAGSHIVWDSLKTANNCDSVYKLNLNVKQSHSVTDTMTICTNMLPHVWNGVTFNSAGDQSVKLSTALGCDSVVNMTLIVNPAYTGVDAISVYDTICSNELPYGWRDTTFLAGTMSGDFVFHRSTVNGCDSTVILHLVINELSVTVASVTDEICGNDGSVTVTATGKAPYEYSLDGVTFQSTPTFTGLASGNHTITARDANGCTATTTAVITPALTPSLTFTCPPDIRDTLAYGDCAMKIYPAELGTPTAVHSLGWSFTITNDAPADSLYPEGDNIVMWIMKDDVCGFADTCYQHILVVFPECPNAVDCEGYVYAGVRIGCDCWTQRNLESTKYSDCTDIPCVYEYTSHEHPNITENVDRYGRLYCYEAAVRDSTDNGHGHIQGICPEGWYLPTPEKYEGLNTYGANALMSPLYWIPSGGNNSTGFSALPAGFYNGATNRFESMLGETYFWSTAGVGSNTNISTFSIIFECNELIETHRHEGLGYSVRCIKEKD
jgi:uncharacterized protein (TIGR02145 family)